MNPGNDAVQRIGNEALLGLGLMALVFAFFAWDGSRRRRPGPSLSPAVHWGIGLPAVVFSVWIGASGLLGLLFHFTGMDFLDNPIPFLLAGGGALVLLVLGVWGYLQRKTAGALPRTLGLQPPRWLSALGWALFGLLALPLPFLLAAAGTQALFQSLGMDPGEQGLIEALRKHIDSGAVQIAVFLSAVLIAPFIEEFFFRGLLFRSLQKYTGDRWPPIILSGFVFALFHFHPPSVLPLWVVGIFLADVYDRSGTLWAPIFLHALFNGAQLGILFLARQGPLG